MVTLQNVNRSLFAEVLERGFLDTTVLVRSFATHHNLHYGTRQGTSTDVSSGEGRLLDPLMLIRCNDNVERPVQPSLRTSQPFYPDVYSPPLVFHEFAVPLTDRLEVELAAVAESQPRPQHGGTVACAV